MRTQHSISTAGGDRSGVHGLPIVAGYAWLAGACVALWSTLQPGWESLALACIAATAAAATRRAGLACLLGGFVLTAGLAQQQVAARWPTAHAGDRVLVVGVIDSLPARRGDAVEFDLAGEVRAPATRTRALRVRVTWRAPPVVPRAGERWQLLLRLRPPRLALNPGSLDRERFLFRERIDALGSVVPSALARREAAPDFGWDALREAIAGRIRESVADRDAAALIAGLAVGATADMTREQWRVFGATGTVHLVAISGLHVTMFAWLATAIGRRVWRVARLGRACDREPFAAAVGLAAAAGYALLAGFSVPTQRTLLMLAVWWSLRLAGRPQGGLEVIGLALLAVLLFDPLAPLAAGFWLSFAAIAVLVAADGAVAGGSPRARADPDAATFGPDPVARAASPAGMVRRRAAVPGAMLRWCWRGLRDLAVIQCCITLALAPATLLLFGSVPLAGVVANLLAIPFFSVLLVPLILAGLAAWPLSPGLAAALWQLAERLYLASWPLLEALADLPMAVWSAAPAAGWLAVGLLAIPVVLLPGPLPLRATGIAALLPLLGAVRAEVAHGEFVAMLLDTGDAASLLVMTRTRTLVYDTGDVYGSDGSRAAGVVLPALRAFGRREIDLVVQSRATGFRVAGVATLLAGLPVAEVRSGGRWTASPRQVAGCERSAGWFWDGVEVRVFPGRPPGSREQADASCVLRVVAQGGRGAALLVPAQVDRAEATLLAARAARERLRADVVLAPRRGSPAAVTPAFVAAIGAREVLVPGRELPDARRGLIASIWRLPAARIVGTAREGAILLHSRRDPARLESVRLVDRQPRWLWRVPRD